MNISAPFIRRPVATSLLSFALLAFMSDRPTDAPWLALPSYAFDRETHWIDSQVIAPGTMGAAVESALLTGSRMT